MTKAILSGVAIAVGIGLLEVRGHAGERGRDGEDGAMSGEQGNAVITTRQHEDGSYTVHGWRVNGSVECPRCGEEAALYEDIEEFEVYTGKITCWGPGVAECCGLTLICSWDWNYVLELEEP